MGYTKRKKRHRRLLAETGGCCMYCGKNLSVAEATIDHIIPLSRGGYTEDENLTVCCYECNQNKETLYVKDFIALMNHHKQRAFYNRTETLFRQGKICEEKYLLLKEMGSVNKCYRLYIRIKRFEFRLHLHINIKNKKRNKTN